MFVPACCGFLVWYENGWCRQSCTLLFRQCEWRSESRVCGHFGLWFQTSSTPWAYTWACRSFSICCFRIDLCLFLPAAYDALQGWARYESSTAGSNAERGAYLVIAPDWFNCAYANHSRINRLSVRLASVVSELAECFYTSGAGLFFCRSPAPLRRTEGRYAMQDLQGKTDPRQGPRHLRHSE